MAKQIKTTTIELEITFEYDDAHFNLSAERMAEATAIDMVVRPSKSIEDSVELLSVCDSSNETYWLDRGREENEQERLRKQFIDYCKQNFNVPQYEIDKALDLMGRDRCPLRMASDDIVGAIHNLADEFIADKGLVDDWFFDNFSTEDEVFFSII